MSGMPDRATSLIRAKVAKGYQDENGPVGTIPAGWREVAGD
jgi:predicted DNA-binding WGR domain protein